MEMDWTAIMVDDAAGNFRNFVNRVHDRAERFGIRRGREAAAVLQPAPLIGRDLLALIESLPRLDPDDINAFERDIEDARSALPPIISS